MKLKPPGHKSQPETATLPILTALVSVATLTRRASPKENSPCVSSYLKHAGENQQRITVTCETGVRTENQMVSKEQSLKRIPNSETTWAIIARPRLKAK